MAIPDNVQAALTRLSGGYNNSDYNASTNPLGFSNGGHRINLYALTADFVLVGAWYEGLSEPINALTDEITALGALATEIQALAAIDDDISTLAAIHAAVSTAAGIAANITTVAGIAANVTAVAGISAAVTNVSGIKDDVSAVADIDDDVTQVSTIHGDVTQVSTIHAAVSSVSGIAADVTAVSGIKDDVTAVSGIHAAVSTAASDSADIATVASDSADIRTLADLQDGTVATGALADLATIKDDITAAVGNATDISAVADNAADVTTVATSIANVNKVAAVDDEVAAVAAVDDEVAAVAGIAANVTTAAGAASAITSVAADLTNIDAVAADLANVDTVAGIAADVTDVAGIAANVSTVAANDADITTVASNIAAVGTTAGVATEIATIAPIAADVTAVADIDTDVTAVSGVKDAVTTLAAVDSEIAALGPQAADIATVAGIGGTDIATVAGAAADIATAATNIVAIQGAAGAASDAADARDAAEAYATTTKALTLHFNFNDATSDADPGSGKIAFGDDTPADVTVLYFSTSEANGGDVTDWLARFDTSTNLTDRGEITFVKDGAPGTWAKFKVIDATTTATGYRKIAVAYVAHAGTWANGDSFGVSFARTGNAGTDGEGAGNVNYVSTTPAEGQLIAAGGSTNTIKDGGVSVSTDGTMAGNSDAAVPTQKAVKTYADTKLPSSYLDTDGTLAANSDTKVASQKAVKTYALPSSYLDTDGSLTADSDAKVPSQKAIKSYVDALLAANDAMVFKGLIDCSSNPNYPAADTGHTYRVSVAGKIGGASGANVEIGDILICLADGTSAGNQATVGSSWTITQTNIDGFTTVVQDQINAASSKTTPADSDRIGIADSAASYVLKYVSWTNIKATLKTYFDTLYAPPGVPQVSKSAAYTLVLGDANCHLLHPSADTTARTFTIPANSSVAYPVGTAITFVNQNSAGVVTIAITSDTMRLAGAGTTGSRTLAANGVATALKITSTEWIISGTGLT